MKKKEEMNMSYWKNLPNTETPITAESLERSEKYVIATATTNGDYKINADVELVGRWK